jgi:hypothetical protein
MSARVWTAVGLIAGGAGLVGQQLAGVAMPAVPPGLVMVVVAAVLLLATRLRWAPVAGAVAGLAEVAGFFGSGSAGRLVEFAEPAAAASSWVRLAGVVLAVVAGSVATVAAYRRAPSVA